MAKANRVREETLAIKVTPEEKRILQEAADKVGLTMSAYFRFVMLHGKKVE